MTTRTKTKERQRIDNLNRAKGFGRGAINTDKVETEEVTTDEETIVKNCDGESGDDGEEPENKPEPPKTVSLTQSELESYVKTALDRANSTNQLEIARLKSESDKATTEAKKEADRLKVELEEQKAKQDTLNAVFGQFSLNAPSTTDNRSSNVKTTRSSEMDAKDALKEYQRILDSRSDTPNKTWVNPKTGEEYDQKDTYQADRFLSRHREKLRDGMEAFARKNGLLRGQGADAATVRADIPPAFIDYLSGVVRQNHSPKFIFHQFANSKIEIGKGEGDVIQIPRLPFGQTGTTLADWDITGLGTLVVTDQPITASSVSITLKEYGMGKNATIQPISIPEFILARSLLDLEAALSQNLGQNYYEFEDIGLRNLWFGTSRVVYNRLNTIETVPANLVAGSGGTITFAFLNNLYAYMSGLQIPAYENGKYGIVLNSTALAQLSNDLATRNQYLTKDSMMDITNILNAATKSDLPKIDGYCGDIANFMIFTTNAISLGIAGTVGVRNETLGVGIRTTRTNFAFGASTIARVAGMPMSIRRDMNDDFGRRNRYVWVSHEGFGTLDVDPVLNASQQLRVIEVRHVDVAL